MYKCSLCKRKKDKSEFHHGSNKNGLNSWCKKCVLKRSKEFRSRNPEKYRLTNKIWRKKNIKRAREISRNSHKKVKQLIISIYGGMCQCCGETEIKFLSIDHILNDGAKERRKTKGGGIKTYMFLKKLFKKGVIKKNKYQVLCFNCNLAKAHHGTCPHKKK